ncbi:MAG TPA: hypothetical protein VMA73_05105 [Streptosporangiaceae bacterium]|nr:hypothetical protein [Streptosporangiaceae bacterium]
MLAGKPDRDLLRHWHETGVTDMAFGIPDRADDLGIGSLGPLAGRLGLS